MRYATAGDAAKQARIRNSSLMAKSLKRVATRKSAPKNHRMPWTAQEDRLMRKLVKDKFTAAAIARELGRSAAAIQQRLMMSGISLRAARKVKTRKVA